MVAEEEVVMSETIDNCVHSCFKWQLRCRNSSVLDEMISVEWLPSLPIHLVVFAYPTIGWNEIELQRYVKCKY
jgi:hypothetical protein